MHATLAQKERKAQEATLGSTATEEVRERYRKNIFFVFV
jgi:hypothetical protein